jgi:pyruvate,water dikinase
MNINKRIEFLTRLKGAEKAFLVNDDHCFFLDLSSVGYLRLALVKIASLFIDTGVIEKSCDIDFLTLDEIKDILHIIQFSRTGINYQETIEKRKLEYNDQKHIIPPAYIGIDLLLDNPKEGTSLNEIKTPMLKGISGLQKKVTGKVKVITDNNNIKLQGPSILVLKHGHASYFLPFINQIKGLIYDGGSPYDHPGIIARELLIPSLYNTQNATKVLKDGDEVELDGVNGCVTILRAIPVDFIKHAP